MSKSRLEAFSDGVIAIIITIMVLELKVPHEPTFAALSELAPVFFSYVLSFVYIGIYWNNHHHLWQAGKQVNGQILWANLHLLFWLSLIPFATAWSGETNFDKLPMAVYGFVLWMAGFAYFLLVRAMISHHGKESALALALAGNFKEIVSLVGYSVAVIVAFFNSWISFDLYVAVALVWLIPDSRIERVLK
ncbi:MAG: TMEM175 family protein [Chloroflexota bacterium]